MKSLLTISWALLAMTVMAQSDKKSVVIGSMTTKPNAVLIVNPPNADQGVLLPQLSTGQRMSLKPSSPSENGLIVFDTNFNTYYYWSDGAWVRLHSNNRAKISFYSIDPVNFQEVMPGSSSDNHVAIFETDNTFVTASANNMGENIIAPVDLPHGAVIKELTVYYMDQDADNLKVYFMRKSLSGANENIISWESEGTFASVRRQSFNSFNGFELVDRENYTYRIVVAFDMDAEDDIVDEPGKAKQRIYGIGIKYQE